MCGIVAYVGQQNARGILIEGLKRLEYRGYDSSGIAILDGPKPPYLARAVGKVAGLETPELEHYRPVLQAAILRT